MLSVERQLKLLDITKWSAVAAAANCLAAQHSIMQQVSQHLPTSLTVRPGSSHDRDSVRQMYAHANVAVSLVTVNIQGRQHHAV